MADAVGVAVAVSERRREGMGRSLRSRLGRRVYVCV